MLWGDFYEISQKGVSNKIGGVKNSILNLWPQRRVTVIIILFSYLIVLRMFNQKKYGIEIAKFTGIDWHPES